VSDVEEPESIMWNHLGSNGYLSSIAQLMFIVGLLAACYFSYTFTQSTIVLMALAILSQHFLTFASKFDQSHYVENQESKLFVGQFLIILIAMMVLPKITEFE
jgi:hypothetical protein